MQRKYEYRRRLPHYQSDSKAIFITFCTYERWILPEFARTICLDVCLRGNGVRFALHAAIIMPDHVHIVLMPLSDKDGPFSIPAIMQTIKGASSHRINAELAARRTVWQQESFDRVLRKEEHIADKTDYILENPVRAGLVKNSGDYPWLWQRY